MNIFKKMIAILALSASTGAMASPITVDAGWYGFCFGGVGSGATTGCQNDGVGTGSNPFTFSSTGTTLLKVTDAFDVGDVFDVYVDGFLSFSTSAPSGSGNTTSPDVAFGSGMWSSGSVLLAAGSYSIDIIVAASPFGSGGAYLEVESVQGRVPVPASVWLFAIGLAALGALRRKCS